MSQMARRGASAFRLALRFLRGSYGSLSLTVIALACGVALVCAIDLINGAVLRAFDDVIDNMAGGPLSRSARVRTVSFRRRSPPP